MTDANITRIIDSEQNVMIETFDGVIRHARITHVISTEIKIFGELCKYPNELVLNGDTSDTLLINRIAKITKTDD